jgi:hypothetical protein
MADSTGTVAKLEVLTLNTWGLWLVSKKRWRRMQHLARALAASSAVSGQI